MAFLTRMVLAQRVPFLFTAAQILRGTPLSVLHFFSPLGAGGAGGTPRQVRVAYSRMRCLPRPKGWASAPTGRFCAALTYCSAHTFRLHRAGRSGLNLSRTKIERPTLPLPWAFYRSKIGYCQGKKCAGGLGTLAQPPGVSVCCDASVFGEKTAPRHSCPQRGQHRVSLLWRYTERCYPSRRRATQALTGADMGFCLLGLRSSI